MNKARRRRKAVQLIEEFEEKADVKLTTLVDGVLLNILSRQFDALEAAEAERDKAQEKLTIVQEFLADEQRDRVAWQSERDELRQNKSHAARELAALKGQLAPFDDGDNGISWCGDCGYPMEVVRPGKVQCGFCEMRAALTERTNAYEDEVSAHNRTMETRAWLESARAKNASVYEDEVASHNRTLETKRWLKDRCHEMEQRAHKAEASLVEATAVITGLRRGGLSAGRAGDAWLAKYDTFGSGSVPAAMQSAIGNGTTAGTSTGEESGGE